jgi:hypothetical protein
MADMKLITPDVFANFGQSAIVKRSRGQILYAARNSNLPPLISSITGISFKP